MIAFYLSEIIIIIFAPFDYNIICCIFVFNLVNLLLFLCVCIGLVFLFRCDTRIFYIGFNIDFTVITLIR